MPWFVNPNQEDIPPDKQTYYYVPPRPRLIPLVLLRADSSTTTSHSIIESAFPVSCAPISTLHHSFANPTALTSPSPKTTIPYHPLHSPQHGQDAFPTEIWEQIFGHLNYMDQPALLRCMCTCSKLAILGKTILPRNLVMNPDFKVDLRSRTVSIVKSKNSQLDRHISESLPHVQFLTIHSHRSSNCPKNTAKWILSKDSIHTLKIVLRPISSPYHRYQLGGPRVCHSLIGLKPRTIILDDFTIGMVKLDCEGIPISLYDNVEEIILRCGPIPVNLFGMTKIHTFPQKLPKLKKLLIILPPRNALLENTEYHSRSRNMNMMIFGTFLRSIPSNVGITIVNLNGFSPGQQSISRIPWNTPRDVGSVMFWLIWRDHPRLSVSEIYYKLHPTLRRIKCISMEEYLWKENWYGVFGIGYVERWIPYLSPLLIPTVNPLLLHL